MKHTVIIILLVIWVCAPCLEAQSQVEITLRAVEFFGLDDTTAAELYRESALSDGNTMFLGDLRRRLQEIKKSLEADPEIIFVNIDQVGIPRDFGDIKKGYYVTIDVVTEHNEAFRSLRTVPDGAVSLEGELKGLLNKYETACRKAEDSGIDEEDREGFYYYDDADVRLITARMKIVADSAFAHLSQVIMESSDETDRAAAATLIGAATDKQAAVRVLIEATRDPDAGVRNNAARVMIPITAYGVSTKAYEVPVDPFLAMIQLPTATDRNKAGLVLGHRVAGEPYLGQRIRQEIGELLVRMAESKQPNNYYTGRGLIRAVSGRDYSDHPDGWRAWLIE